MAQSKSKCRKLIYVDRISVLPDSLICHILSFLPTKHAVATTILATRWKQLWTMVPTLDFGDDDFVFRVLALRKPFPVKKFRLVLRRVDVNQTHVLTWISYAIEHGVQELHLLVKRNRTCELPRSLFSCESLEVLELKGLIVLDCPPSVHLPNLKHLYLKQIEFANDYSLLTGSPNLLRLHVLNEPYDNVNLVFNNPKLEYLKIDNLVEDPRFGKLQINAPNLKFLILNNPNFHDFSVGKGTNVVEANVNLFERYQLQLHEHENDGDCIVKLLKALPNVRNLTLRHNKSLSFASANDIPIFNNLSHLRLEVKCCKSHLLPILLQSSPNLENLVLSKVDTGPHESYWTEPVNVPKCLKLHLRTISLLQFKGLKHELKLVTYMLENAKVLERMDIRSGSSSYKKNFRILKKLFELPRASSTCEFKFSTVEKSV
ncbi:F-box/FBD/LRR-repeat protein At4g26340-like [Castanea sativa]|uniref:F-box/FBD/LRR-repeat protein At4g26340-like n=1 Tax=Castanea sativa TaxID=21020 RepID=UPI003F651E75